jgi:hypothetical protein
MAYLKTADNMGQSQTQCYRFEAVNADGTPIKPQEQPTQPDFSEFVKVQDIQKFGFVTKEQFDALSKKIDEIQNQKMGVKPNVGTNKPQV